MILYLQNHLYKTISPLTELVPPSSPNLDSSNTPPSQVSSFQTKGLHNLCLLQVEMEEVMQEVSDYKVRLEQEITAEIEGLDSSSLYQPPQFSPETPSCSTSASGKFNSPQRHPYAPPRLVFFVRELWSIFAEI